MVTVPVAERQQVADPVGATGLNWPGVRRWQWQASPRVVSVRGSSSPLRSPAVAPFSHSRSRPAGRPAPPAQPSQVRRTEACFTRPVSLALDDSRHQAADVEALQADGQRHA
jgi:hypothetical protein